MAGADLARAIAIGLLAVAVWIARDDLAAIAEVESTDTNVAVFALLLVAAVVLGCAEVVRDTASQTLAPALVAAIDLERANGRLWSAERLANSLAGPALGALLISGAYALPLAVESAAFLIAAGCIATISPVYGTMHRRPGGEASPPVGWWQELTAGVRVLWEHRELRAMAIALAGLNLAGLIGAGTYVLFAQEVLGIGPVLFAIVGFGGALGGVLGGFVAPRVSDRIGDGASLAVACGGLVLVALTIALFPYWPVVLAVSVIEFFCVTIWSVVTLTFRQFIVPASLLGRANGAHRSVGWGAMPIGAGLGALWVTAADRLVDREWALRSVWFAAAAVYLAVFVGVVRRLPDTALRSALASRTA